MEEEGSGDLLETAGQGGLGQCPLYGLAALLFLEQRLSTGAGATFRDTDDGREKPG